MPAKLPPGPRQPSIMQTIGFVARPVSTLERARARFGKRFTMQLAGTPPFVMISDPDEIKQVFTAPPDVLHPGEGASILEPIIGGHSVILLDEGEHMAQRKLMLPAFHGEKMEKLTGLITDVAEREAASWPKGEKIELHPRLQALTMEIILRAVFGLDPGPRLDAMRDRLTNVLELGTGPTMLVSFLHRDLGPLTPFKRFAQLRSESDQLIFELIHERRAEAGDRDDILSMLLEARHEDGSPMSDQELRDELMTLLVAGHETTASSLAWAFERLLRTPAVLGRLVEEVDSDDGDDYMMATIRETLRRRPVLPNAQPRMVVKPIEVGGWDYPTGVNLVCSAYLVQHDPEIYPDPYAFKPERFLDQKPGTYTWIPFGGGRRRCLGASFAQLEMQIVLRAVLRNASIEAAEPGFEVSRRRNITVSPRAGARAVLRDRARQPVVA